jgi:hypothetical protein
MGDLNPPEVREEHLPDGSRAIRGPRGAVIVINHRVEDVMRMQFGGHIVPEMMARTLAGLDQVLPAGEPFAIAVDADAQSGYEPEVRALATAWLLKHRDRLRASYFLGKAPMVKLGIQMINNSLGAKVFSVFEDRREFERGVGKVLRESEKMRVANRS